jgi:hypothetical protein
MIIVDQTGKWGKVAITRLTRPPAHRGLTTHPGRPGASSPTGAMTRAARFINMRVRAVSQRAGASWHANDQRERSAVLGRPPGRPIPRFFVWLRFEGQSGEDFLDLGKLPIMKSHPLIFSSLFGISRKVRDSDTLLGAYAELLCFGYRV